MWLAYANNHELSTWDEKVLNRLKHTIPPDPFLVDANISREYEDVLREHEEWMKNHVVPLLQREKEREKERNAIEGEIIRLRKENSDLIKSGISPSYIQASGDTEDAKLSVYKPESQIRTMISPREFLSKAPIPDNLVNRLSVEKLKNRMLNGLPIDAVFLDYDIQTGKFVSHEGRHRSLAAKELGIPEIPCIIFVKDGYQFVDAGLAKDLSRGSSHVFQ